MSATDSLNDAAAQVILSALHAAEVTGAWLKGQIPEVLHQLLVWNFVEDAIGVAAWLLFFFGYWRLMAAFIARAKSFEPKSTLDSMDNHGWFFAYLIPCIAGTIAAGIGVVCVVVYVEDAVEILVAPKVWILEYARSLL